MATTVSSLAGVTVNVETTEYVFISIHRGRQVINLFRTIDITLIAICYPSILEENSVPFSWYSQETLNLPALHSTNSWLSSCATCTNTICGKWWDDKKWFVNKSNQDKSEISSWFIMPQKRIITASLVVESLATVSLQCGWLNVGSSWWRCTEKYRFGFCTRYAY